MIISIMFNDYWQQLPGYELDVRGLDRDHWENEQDDL